MKHPIITTLFISTILFSCNRVVDKTKDTVNKGGEIVGKTATEFVEGISEGIERTLDCELFVSDELKEKGIQTGKFTIENDTVGEDNKLVIYLILEQDFNDTITVKAMDKSGLEVGRSKLNVKGKSGDAGYYDFIFDSRTDIEVKSKIVIE